MNKIGPRFFGAEAERPTKNAVRLVEIGREPNRVPRIAARVLGRGDQAFMV